MRKILFACASVLLCSTIVHASVEVTFTRDGGLSLLAEGVLEHQTYTVELWLTNTFAGTTALSAYQFDFDSADFATGKLDASNWIEGVVFDGLSPAWIPVDQALDTETSDYLVSGVTGSLSTPFVGPSLPLNTPVLIGTLDVYVDALAGDSVDFVLGVQTGIDDQDGNFGGAGVALFGVESVPVVPEPTALGLLLLGTGLASLTRRQRPLNRRGPA
jgi:hypothetical protein